MGIGTVTAYMCNIVRHTRAMLLSLLYLLTTELLVVSYRANPFALARRFGYPFGPLHSGNDYAPEESFPVEEGGAPLQQMKLTFDCTAVDPDLISELMFECGVNSVSVEVQSEKEGVMNDEANWWDLQKTKNWKTALLRANFPLSFDQDGLKDVLKASYPDIPFFFEIVDVENKDWVSFVQKDWKPTVINDLTIRFPWHNAEASKTKLELILEGGAAFGTGDHETTRLCCKWLSQSIQNSRSDLTVLDYGCGSAILALASIKYGASSAVGTDIDKDALVSAYNNCKLNKLEDKVKLYLVEDGENTEVSSIQMNNFRGNSIAFPSVASLEGSQYDLVVANILAPILIYLAETLANHTKPGGKIALSGLVYQQQEAITNIYSRYFTNVKVEAIENDWILVTGEKPKPITL